MEAIAHLQFGDNYTSNYNKTYNVVKCFAHFTKGFSSRNVSTDAYCESIEVTVVAPNKDDLELQEWFLSGTSRTGRLNFQLMDVATNGSFTGRSIEFDDAQCFRLKEYYDIHESNQLLLTLTFIPKVCEVEHNRFLLRQ